MKDDFLDYCDNLDDEEEGSNGEMGLSGDFEDDYEAETVIFHKNGVICLLAYGFEFGNGAIIRIDPREPRPTIQLYDDLELLRKWFRKSIETSIKNGWKIGHQGEPNWG